MIPEGVATSIKSIDLNAATYHDAARLTYRINKYVGDLADFDGASWGTDVVKSSDIKSRTLNLIVPRGGISEVQEKAIAAAQERARSMNSNPVKIIITEF
jgi:filamentous hemagglutinin